MFLHSSRLLYHSISSYFGASSSLSLSPSVVGSETHGLPTLTNKSSPLPLSFRQPVCYTVQDVAGQGIPLPQRRRLSTYDVTGLDSSHDLFFFFLKLPAIFVITCLCFPIFIYPRGYSHTFTPWKTATTQSDSINPEIALKCVLIECRLNLLLL